MTKILFVEPDKSLGVIYKNYFSKLGYKVNWEQSADDAIKSIDKDLPDLIFIELQLAIHNGLELIYEIRSYPEWSDLNIVLNTNIPESRLLKSPVYKFLKISKHIYKPTSSVSDLNEVIKSVTSQ